VRPIERVILALDPEGLMREQDGTAGSPAITARLSEALEAFVSPRPMPATSRDAELLRRGEPLPLSCGLAATAWGDGPTVLLAHGWESRRTHWGAFIGPLVTAGFRAVAIDAPAHGDSPGTRTNVLEYGRTLVSVGRELGPLAGVVAHSFGAAATAIALHLGLTPARVVLISGPAAFSSVAGRWGRQFGLSEREIPEFIELAEREVGEPTEELDVVRFAPGLSTSALVIHDRNDQEVPVEEALAVVAAWPGSRSLITERYGHRRIMLAGEVVRQTVEFLNAGRTRSATGPGG
jgi:hypothetical protein